MMKVVEELSMKELCVADEGKPEAEAYWKDDVDGRASAARRLDGCEETRDHLQRRETQN